MPRISQTQESASTADVHFFACKKSAVARPRRESIRILAPSHRAVVRALLLMLLPVASVAVLAGCRKSSQGSASRLAQEFENEQTKTDSLRSGMRFLAQMQPFSRDNYITEIQKQLNTWMQTADRNKVAFSTPSALQAVSQEALAMVGAENPVSLQFSYMDVDYLFQCRMASKLSSWIVDFPLRDNLVSEYLKFHESELSEVEYLQLQQACKLFDWTTRNITLESDGSSVELTTDNPTTLPPGDLLGAGYLPWETLMFSNGDFIERGRVFTALARQRGIKTFWICSDADIGNGKIWAIGAAIGKQVFLFEPKLGMPILHPDEQRLATLKEARENTRVLRRLDLPGQFDYSVVSADLARAKLLIDVAPCADSARMKMLEASLLQDERMVVYQNISEEMNAAKMLVPDAAVELWSMPLFAQIRALETREMAKAISDEAMRYMAVHGVWLMRNPASEARLKHLFGRFENTSDGEKGALDLYMDSRIDDQSIEQLLYDPDRQKELGIERPPGEPAERFEQRIRQAQAVYTRAKVDAAFLLAQLHYDRGNYSQSASFMDRVLRDDRAVKWFPAARYCKARIHQELLEVEQARQQLTAQPNPQEAGNRIRLRYFLRLHPLDSSSDPGDSADADADADAADGETSKDAGEDDKDAGKDDSAE
jgi:hypothetical protein